MNMKKKLLAVALGVTCCLSFAGCGDDAKQTASTDKATAARVVETTDVATKGEKKDWKIAVVVKAYLRFAASTRGQDTSSKATGCAPITREMREKINAAIDKISA